MKFIRGIATSEFWASAVAAALPWALDSIPAHWKAGLSTVAAVAYTVSRGLAKLGFKGEPGGK